MRRALFGCLAGVFCAFCAFCVFALIVVPDGRAYAVGGYSIDELSTRLTVQTDASVHVVERQTLTFSDGNAGVVWYLHAPEDGESVRISSVRVAPVDDGGTLLADWTRLQMVDSDPGKQGRNPGDTAALSLRTAKVQPWYSYNIGDGMVRCYFPTGTAARAAEGGEGDGAGESGSGSAGSGSASAANASGTFRTYLIETDYTVAHRVRVFRDVGELYWRYAHDNLPADARGVSLQVVLPTPGETDPATASGSVRAWGHGPDEGTFSIGADGSVTYEVGEVARGSYAEAHVIFPASWLVNVAVGTANQFSELRGPAAIAEESEWVDLGLREAAWDNKVRVLFLGVALVVVLLGTVGALRRGRSPLARRALVRTGAALGIVALGESLFFREPVTTVVLALAALAAFAVALALPAREAGAGAAGEMVAAPGAEPVGEPMAAPEAEAEAAPEPVDGPSPSQDREPSEAQPPSQGREPSEAQPPSQDRKPSETQEET